jgi:hypothetical protein
MYYTIILDKMGPHNTLLTFPMINTCVALLCGHHNMNSKSVYVTRMFTLMDTNYAARQTRCNMIRACS